MPRHPSTFFWVERHDAAPDQGQTVLTGHDLRPPGRRRRGVLQPGPITPRGQETMILRQPEVFHCHLDFRPWCRREWTLEPGVERDWSPHLLCDDPDYYLIFEGAVRLDPTAAGKERMIQALRPEEKATIPAGKPDWREWFIRARWPAGRATLPVWTPTWSGVLLVEPENPQTGHLIAFAKDRVRPSHEGEIAVMPDTGQPFGWVADALPPGFRATPYPAILLWVDGLQPNRYGSQKIELTGHDLLPRAWWSRSATPNELVALRGREQTLIRWAEVLHMHQFVGGWHWYTFTPEVFPEPPFLLTDDPAYRLAFAGAVRMEAAAADRQRIARLSRRAGQATVPVWTARWCGVLTVESPRSGHLLAFAWDDAGPIAWEQEAIMPDDGRGQALGRLAPA